MKKKIKEYVYYQLRFDTEVGNQELKEEIVSNINDRYDEIFEKTNDSNYAYINAIKSMGDFAEGKNYQNEISAYKPSVPEMFLIAGVILAIFGVLIVFFSNIAGAIVIMTSIVSFSVGASYIYQESQYIKEVEFDIEKHNDYLTKIFSYVKTCFVFWAIGIAYLLAALINSIITSLMIAESMQSLTVDDFQSLLIMSVVLFILIFIIFLAILKKLHDRLIVRYYELTGENELESKIRTAKTFIGVNKKNGDLTKKNYFFNRVWFYPLVVSVLIILFLFTPIYMYFRGNISSGFNGILLSVLTMFGNYTKLSIVILVLMIPIAIVIVLIVLKIFNKIKNRFIVPISFIGLSIIHIVIASLDFGDLTVSPTSAPIGFLGSIVLSVFLIIDLILNSSNK